jgi:hypothetical protein
MINNKDWKVDRPFLVDPTVLGETPSLTPSTVDRLPSMVIVCLAPCDRCTGEYRDITSSYRMRCCCHCHDNSAGKTMVNEGGIS